jgi:HEAT repeat protein
MTNEPRNWSLNELIEQIGSTNEYTAMAALEEAVRRTIPEVVPAVVSACRSADEWVSAEAARSLGMLHQLLNGAGMSHRSSALTVLSQLLGYQPPDSRDIPIDLDSSNDQGVFYAAAVMLCELDDVRFEAARSLGQIAHVSSVPLLFNTLTNGREHNGLRHVSARALLRIGQANPDDASELSSMLRSWVASARRDTEEEKLHQEVLAIAAILSK